jgi:4-hydroxy-2-oxoheptanedioate aldolase
MDLPVNHFKRALHEGRPQFGLWVGLADAYAAELLAGTGYDWLLIDGEHAPNDLRSILAQLQAVAPYAAQPIVRPPVGDAVLIKQLLDAGALSLLIPMVESAEQAAQLVAATRYPPRGVRGVGSALARSSRWNQVEGYLQQAERELCLLVQVESVKALKNVEAIAAVEGVDGVFFGPADLSASMGLLGQPGHADVQLAIKQGMASVRAAGKAAGVLCADTALAQSYLAAGASFVALGVDATLLVRAAREQLAPFKSTPATSAVAADQRGAY